MPNIRPVSDLRNNFKELEKIVRESGEPLFLTVNGRASMVLMSNDAYDALVAGADASAFPTAKDVRRATEADAAPSAETLCQFGKVVERLMEVRRVSAEDIALRTSLTENQVDAILDGAYVPTDEQICELAAQLDVENTSLTFFLENSSGKLDKGVKKMLAGLLGKIADVTEGD